MRPCSCDKYRPGIPMDPSQDCRLCWLYHNDPSYRALWGGRSFALPVLPCKNLGRDTGEKHSCTSCGGAAKQVPVFECSVFGTCSPKGPLKYKDESNNLVEVKNCCVCKALTSLGKEGGEYVPDTSRLVAPLTDTEYMWEGIQRKKPWEYKITVVLPHLETLDTLEAVVWLLRLQTERPYIVVIDTGSSEETCKKLESLRHEDLEIHYIRSHGYIHSSAPVTTAMDLGFALCKTSYLFSTHTDVFLKRRDFLSFLLSQCTEDLPVVGWEMSPRAGTEEWRGIPSHTATLYYMPTMRSIGATWSLERWYGSNGIPARRTYGWPDTESTMGECLKKGGIPVKLLGSEPNFQRHQNDWFDHARSLSGTRAYNKGSPQHLNAERYSRDALVEAISRVKEWGGPEISLPLPS